MKRNAYSLIELMVVCAIIAMLLSTAIPSYLNYMVRAKVVEGFSLASAAKTAVVQSVVDHSLPLDQAQTGYLSPQSSKYVSSISIANDGSAAITIQYTKEAGDGSIILVPTLRDDDVVVWTCKGGTLASKYRPPNCR